MKQKKETKYVLEKDKIIMDDINCCGIFYLPKEDLNIIELSGSEFKKQKLKFLKDVFNERMEIFKDGKKCMVLSSELWDKMKKVFDVFGSLESSDFYIADEESPLIIKYGSLGGIIATRVGDE